MINRCHFWVWILAFASLTWRLPGADSVQLIRPGDEWAYRAIGSSERPPEGWFKPGFSASDWTSGTAGFSAGFGTYQIGATALGPTVGADDLRGLVLRREFVVTGPVDVLGLWLRVEYEDGLRVWLNGTEVVRSGYGPEPEVRWEATPASHPTGNADVFDLTPFASRLVAGTNLLSMQVVDATVGWPTLFAWAELRANFLRGPVLGAASSNAVTVCWTTAVPQGGRVELQAEGDAVPRVVVAPVVAAQQEVRVEGLRPGTRYTWRVRTEVGERGVWSETSAFTTLRPAGDATLLVLGDTGEGLSGQHAVADALRREKGDLVLHTGDIVYPSFVPGRMDLRCLSLYEPLMRETPTYFTVGNHDAWGSVPAYLSAFCLPTNSATGSELYYSFDHGEAHVVCLYVPWFGASGLGILGRGDARGPQYAWLTNDLARTSKPWKIVFFHQPPFTSGPHLDDDYDATRRRDTDEAREWLLPILQRHGVQLVMNGHDHTWERFAPTNGVHFVVTGGGGAHLYPLVDRQPGSAQFFSVYHYTRIRIRGPELQVDALDPQARWIDGFGIRLAGTAETSLEAGEHPDPSPLPEPAGVSAVVDGNVAGEEFDLVGPGITAVPAGSANLGRFVVNYDRDRVHFGFRDAMLWPGQMIALFVAPFGDPIQGVTNLVGTGRVRAHPFATSNVGFDGFRPTLVALLGDEFADVTDPQFQRPTSAVALGQGLFRLDDGMTPEPSAQVRQFNRSPQDADSPDEQDAGFMTVSVSRAALGNVLPGQVLRVGALVLTTATNGTFAVLRADETFLGSALTASKGAYRLAPITVTLAAPEDGDLDLDGLSAAEEERFGGDPRNPDTDGDGLPDGWEVTRGLRLDSGVGMDGASGDPDLDGYTNLEEYRSGTDPRDARPTLGLALKRHRDGWLLSWRAMVTRRYDLEVSTNLAAGFVSAGLPGLPRVAGATNQTVLIPDEPGRVARWFRVRESRP